MLILESDATSFNSQRVAHLYSLLKDAGEDQCCLCSKTPDIDNVDKMPSVTKCGHLFCCDCANIFGMNAQVACPVCLTVLSATDVSAVGDEDVVFQEPDDDDVIFSDDVGGGSSKIRALLFDLEAVRYDCETQNIKPVKSSNIY